MLSITFPENVGQSYFDWPIFGLVAMRTYFGLVVVNDPSSKNADIKIVHSIIPGTKIFPKNRNFSSKIFLKNDRSGNRSREHNV